jgi:hypothetical protein
MKAHHLFFLLLPLCFFYQSSFSQSKPEPLISGEFNGVIFSQMVREIEAQAPYHFYFDASVMDSLRVNLRVTAQPLRTVLDQVFKDTDFKYAIDQNNRVYISPGQAIITDFPGNLLEPGKPDAEDKEKVVASYKQPQEDIQEKLISGAESRLYEIGIKTYQVKEGMATLSGYVRNAASGEPVIGAAVYIESPQIGNTTDAFGYYSVQLPRGKHILRIKSVGMRETRRRIMLYSDGKLDIELQESIIALKEVLIKAGKDVNVAGTQMGLEKLSIKTMKQVPSAFGELDLLRVVLMLPGVKTVGESSTGLNVRGGSTDQNLILFNDATIYNPSHLFGFFSAFNPDVMKDMELYKSNIPTRFGGRLSSVLDLHGRDGNKKKFTGSGGIGLITTRLTLEGPLIKDKTSFLIGGRTTYSNWLIKQLNNPSFNRSSASFYDVNVHFSHEINQKNSLTLMGYLSNDDFKLNSDTLYGYQNQLASLQWKHTFNSKLYGVFTGAYSGYQYAIAGEQNPTNAYDLKFGLSQGSVKADFTYFLNSKHSLDFGITSLLYQLKPGSFTPRGSESLVRPDIMENERALESAVYLGDRFDVNPRLSLTAGIRFSFFNYLGPKTVYSYADGLPKEKNYIQGSQSYGSGDLIRSYGGPEYRLSARYMITENLSAKVSYNTMRQYIHLLSNTTAISPTDIWKLSDSHIKPQQGDQLAVGLYKNAKGNSVEISLEAYYKNINNFLDYKGGDSLILNPRIETAVINTKGKAYGVEFMVKRTSGKLNGWVSYTYARTLLQADDANAIEVPNKGAYYPSNYDKPHDFTLVSNYKFSHRFNVSLNFTYSTGRPYTPPIGKYVIEGAQRVFYAERNQYRIPDYYRMDFSMNIEGNHKIKKLSHSSWTLAVYNLLGRKNPYSVYFVTQNGVVNGYQLSIFGQPIPTVTYNFRF